MKSICLSGFASNDIVILKVHNTTTLFIHGIIARILRKHVVIEVDSYINLNSSRVSNLLRFYFNHIASVSLTHVIAYSPEDSYSLRGLMGQKPIQVHFLRTFRPGDEKHVRIQKDILINIDLNQYTLKDKNLDLVVAIAMKLPEMNFLVAVAGIPTRSDIHYLRNMPPNCHFIPAEGGVNLPWIFERSIVYLDLSEKSSDDHNLLKALSAGLAPVVTDSGNLCKAIGRSGRVVSLSDGLDAMVETISSTCNSAGKYVLTEAAQCTEL